MKRLIGLSEGLFKLFKLDGIHEEQYLTLKTFTFLNLVVRQAIMFP